MTDVPISWEIVEIDEVIDIQSDGRKIHQGWSPQCHKEPRASLDEWAVLKTTAVQAGEFCPQHHKRLPVSLSPRPEIEVFVGDLLITCAGPRVRCGVACLIRATEPRLLMSGKMYRFRAIHGATDPRYLEAWLQTEEAQLAIDNMKTGGSDSGLNITHDRFKRLHVRIAPYAEQVRIVEKLEELLSDLDAGVAELKAAQRKLAQYRQSLLKAAVEGALTADWRAAQSASSRRKPGSSRSKDDRDRKRDPGLRRDDEAQETGAELLQRILRERRVRWEQKQLAKFAEQGNTPPKDWQDKYREPVAPDLTDLPPLPERWTWATIEQLAELVSGHTPKDASKFVRDDGVVQWFKVGDMNAPGNESALVEASARFAQEDASELGLKIAPPGTIVFPKRGGAIATNKKRRLSIAAAYDLNMMGLVAVPSTAEWLWSWFKGIDLAKLSDGSNIPQINNPDIAPLHVPLPPAEEQKQVIGRLDDALISVSLQEAAIANALRQAAAQRKNILKAAFSGQLVPQDPNDEPARELLARIRAAREQAPTARSKGRRAGSNPAPATNAHASSRKPRKAKERA